MVITTAQLHSTKPELRFCAGSNPARRVGDSRWWGCLTMVPAGNKAKRLSSVNQTPKTIHQFNSINYISFAGYSIKQHDTVEYRGCQLDSKLRGEALASKVIRKIKAKLKFLYRKSINLPSKNSSWRRLEDAFRLQKTSSRRLDQDQYIIVLVTPLQDVFKTFSRHLQDVFKTF